MARKLLAAIGVLGLVVTSSSAAIGVASPAVAQQASSPLPPQPRYGWSTAR